MENHLEFIILKPAERSELMELLLLADESESVIESYIREGEMFKILINQKLAGVILFVFHSQNEVELKNMALLPTFQGQGTGREVIEQLVKYYRGKGYQKMIVGTANSSIGNIVFYQKAGFRMSAIRKDYFADYPETITENGIRALDMILLERKLDG